MKTPHWKDVYKFPLHIDNYLQRDIVWTRDDERAFDFFTLPQHHILSKEEQQLIVNIINGGKGIFHKVGNFEYGESVIFLDGKGFIDIRGWGHLTGTGGLHLSTEKAKKIQDDFAAYIIQRLNSDNNLLIT